MSSKENPCRKFQANIFNKSKCQNCFKPRESHLLNDEDLNQAKPIYGGWLLLAPEGTNFDNPLQRSRKWQRRFFVLYEHGLLRYALDEMPSTLPQGTINMNQCSEVRDGEARSGQKNALSILTPEREHFIRAECREIINGWQEILTVYPRTNTQNQKKKRKVEPPTPQEPGPAKVTVTSGGGGVEGGGSSAVAGLWQEEEEERWSRTTVPYSRSASCLSQLAQSHPGPPSAQSHPGPPSAQSHPGLSRSARDDGRPAGGGRKVRVESGYFSLEKTRSEPPPSAPPPHRYQPPDLQLYPSQDPPLASPLPSSSPGVPGALASPLPSSSPGAPGAPLSPSSSAVSSSHSSLDSEPSWDGRGGGGGRLSQGRGGDGGGGGGRQGRPGRDGYAALSDVPRARRLSHREAFRSEKRRQELRARTRSPGREEVTRLFGQERRRSQVIGRFESVDGEEQMDTSTEPTSSSLSNEREPASSSLSNEREPASSSLSNERQGRSEKRHLSYQETASSDAGIGRSAPDLSSSFLLNLRRAKSLDRRETSTTPDLLNFKKGWMTKLYDDGTWRKRWFVLTDQSLRFYKDSIAEEAADLDGEIDLSTCYDVTEFPVQRNYGFQILVSVHSTFPRFPSTTRAHEEKLQSKEGACTLSAMTSGIRRNWIQAILKSARPAAPPDVTCSVPEEKARVRVVLGLCPQPSPGPGSEAPRVEVHTQRLGASASVTAAPMSDPRKSRVRERRKEGRCKTYDWSEFRPGQAASGEPKRERAETTVGLSSASSSSTAASPSSSSSTTSSLASSPVSTTSSPHTSSSVSAPPLALSPRVFASPVGEEEREGEPAEQEQARLRNERRLCLQQSPPTLVHAARTVTVTMTSTLSEAAAVGGESRAPEESSSREPIGMEVDHTALDSRGGGRGGSGRPPDVQVEIEQRWHQVETTPLREEKQVPIATTPDPAGIDRPPQQDLTALLDKELGQTQKELAKLHKQNSLLQEQLQDARGREQHARDGYVLQSAAQGPSSSSSPHRVPWQRLHELNRDLQSELEAQKRKQELAQQQVQMLRRSYAEAQDTADRHEADIQSLQVKLSSAMAEILTSEQAVARMRAELKMEQERSREQEEVWGHSEATLRAQLRDSEHRLRQVEASLLERSQALRHLERQQALQRDHLREVQRLQERLQEVTTRMAAMEEGQALKEERLRQEQRALQEGQERERQILTRRLAEAEAGWSEAEERLREAERQVEALLRGGRPTSGGAEEEALRLQEELSQQTDAVEALRESVRRLEDEKAQLTCRCQELLNQVSEADREVTKLRGQLETEEAEYYTLEHSYKRASEEFQKIGHVLREKEEEIRQMKETYERLAERKEEDVNEALVKMAALGSSLEETEQRLQAREELLHQMGHSESRSAERDLQAKLVIAEDRITELERHLRAMRLGYAGLRTDKQRVQGEALLSEGTATFTSLLTNTEPSQAFQTGSSVKSLAEGEESQAKRPRIRFSSIQCQKYVQSGSLDTSQADTTSSEKSQENSQGTCQDLPPSEEASSSDITFQYCSDPEKFISIIHALETKLLTTEEKLRDLTQKLERRQGDQPDHFPGEDCWAVRDPEPRQDEGSSGSLPVQGLGCQIHAASGEYAKALACVETSREKARAVLTSRHRQGGTDSQLLALSEIENELVDATLYIKRGEKTFGKHLSEVSYSQTQETRSGKDFDEERIRLFAKTLSFEAIVLNKMALLIQNPKSDILSEIHQETESIRRSDGDCLAVVYADVLTRKLMLESAFWTEVEKMESHCGVAQGDVVKATGDCLSGDASQTVIFNTCIKAELVHSIQSLKHFYEEKFKVLKRELHQAHINMQQRELALKEIFKASKKPDLEKVIQEVGVGLDFSEEEVLESELTPYMEQIEMEEAKGLAEELVGRHIAGGPPSCSVDSIESLQVGQETLVSELRRQAAILDTFSQEIESGGSSHCGLADIIQAHTIYQTSHNLTSSSLCMRDALIQAQVAYVACRLQADHQRDLGLCQQAGRNMDTLVREHACNVSAIRERYEASLLDEQQGFARTLAVLQEQNQSLRGEATWREEQLSQQQEQLGLLEELLRRETEELRCRHQLELTRAEQSLAATEMALMETTADSQCKLEVLLADVEAVEKRHEGQVRALEEQYQCKIRELQQLHDQEVQRLHAYYAKTVRHIQERGKDLTRDQTKRGETQLGEAVSPTAAEEAWPMEMEVEGRSRSELDSVVVLKERIQELETQMNIMRDELDGRHLEGDVASLREKYQKDFESLKATCERGFVAMEETHHKVVEDLQRQHQREVCKLLEERERLLAEETAATISAIEAMKNAHREELEKTQRSQLSGLSSDINELRLQYEEELQSIHRELEVLSEQYSQKCLENAHLSQALEAERQALRQCQRENQELNAHNQELNNRLTAEISRIRSSLSAESGLTPLTQGKDLYELEVLLRVKESEIQYLKQEIHSLKDELQSAFRDKKYATDKYKDIYTELSIVKAKVDCDISKLKEKLLAATEALGGQNLEGTVAPGYDIMKSKSNPDFLKKERSALSKQSRGIRSKSLKEGLTVQERMKLFEAKDSRKI